MQYTHQCITLHFITFRTCAVAAELSDDDDTTTNAHSEQKLFDKVKDMARAGGKMRKKHTQTSKYDNNITQCLAQNL